MVRSRHAMAAPTVHCASTHGHQFFRPAPASNCWQGLSSAVLLFCMCLLVCSSAWRTASRLIASCSKWEAAADGGARLAACGCRIMYRGGAVLADTIECLCTYITSAAPYIAMLACQHSGLDGVYHVFSAEHAACLLAALMVGCVHAACCVYTLCAFLSGFERCKGLHPIVWLPLVCLVLRQP